MSPTHPQEPRDHFARLGEEHGLWSEELEVLGRQECLDLLHASSFGRVGLEVGGWPVIFPVNYAMLSNGVAFRTAAGTKLRAALTHTAVAFEVDYTDPVSRSGWSVLVAGHATEVRDAPSMREAEKLPISPLAPGDRPHLVVIPIERISGRRF
jgi:nitroimidazol reductase NimA-like FMN-containing flavoprotein (pyridoxamine 5'-phosphate oxidase superfamily)